MSGPKLSEAELEEMRRQELERQRLEQLRKLQEAQKVYNDSVRAMNERAEAIRRWFSESTFLALEKEKGRYAAELRRDIEQKLAQIKAVTVTDTASVSEYEQAAQRTKTVNEALFEQIEKQIAEEEHLRGLTAAVEAKSRSYSAVSGTVRDLTKGDEIKRAVENFSYDGDVEKLRAELTALADFLKKSESSGDKILADISAEGSRELRSYAEMAQLKTRSAQVKERVETVVNAYEERRRVLREFEALYADYAALAGMNRVPPRPRNGFRDEAELRAERDRLSEEYRRRDEMDYIAQQINEAMVELGYGFVSSAVLRLQDGREYDQSVYSADTEAGIAVYTDENGAVMMQTVKFGSGDITPLDEEDCYQLQLDFCCSHQDIVDACERRGVLLRQKDYRPASKKYAKKIQTAADGKKVVVDRRERRRGNKVQYMRKHQ